MKEFDFDELDRAVNSVLGSTSADSSAPKPATLRADEDTSNDEVATSEATPSPRISSHAVHSRIIPSERSHDDRSSLKRRGEAVIPARPEAEQAADTEASPGDTTDVAAESQGASPQPRPRPLARRRSGRFMDVVHPSSDMRTASMGASSVSKSKSAPSTPPQTPATPISDANEDFFATPSPGQAPEPAPELEKAINELLEAESKGELTVDASSESAKSEVSQPAAEENQSTGVPEATPMPTDIDTPPQVSPFLTDAQVEKRPLGGDRESSPKMDTSASELTKPDEEQSAEIDAIHSQIQAIESIEGQPMSEPIDGAMNDVPLVETAAPEATPPETPAPAVETPAPKTVETPQPEKSQSKSEPAEFTGPSSIARQYKETPREASEDDTSAIFDPENYHQPLEHEPKKKSGWGWVIAIIVLILLGAGVAAALWWMGILVVPL